MSLIPNTVYANPDTPCWASASGGGGGNLNPVVDSVSWNPPPGTAIGSDLIDMEPLPGTSNTYVSVGLNGQQGRAFTFQSGPHYVYRFSDDYGTFANPAMVVDGEQILWKRGGDWASYPWVIASSNGMNLSSIISINSVPYPGNLATQFMTAEYAQGSNGGTAPGIATFYQRELNTFYPNLSGGTSTTISGLSVTSNVITLPTGTFKVCGNVGHAMDNGQARFYNLTTSNVALLGTVAGADSRTSYSVFKGYIKVATPETFEVQLAGASLTGGDADYGQAGNFGTECFLELEVQQVE